MSIGGEREVVESRGRLTWLALAVLLASTFETGTTHAAPSPTPVPAFIAGRDEPVAHTQCQNPELLLDCAYDPRSRTVLTYENLPDGLRVRRWAATGSILADWNLSDWNLPGETRPTSKLYQRAGHLRSVIWDKRTQASREVTLLPPPALGVKVSAEAVRYSAIDRSLAPKTFDAVRKLMKELRFIPAPRVGQHVADQSRLIDGFEINAPFVEDTFLAWDPEYTVLSFAWDTVVATVAVRRSDGTYRTEDVRGTAPAGAREGSRGVRGYHRAWHGGREGHRRLRDLRRGP